MLVAVSSAWADAKPEECRVAAENFGALASNVKSLMASAYGYAVFPKIGKAGLSIGGAGCVYNGVIPRVAAARIS